MAFADYAAYKSEVTEQVAGFFTKNSWAFNGTASAWNSSFTTAPDAGANATTTARQCNYLTAGSLIPNARGVMTPGSTVPYWLAEMELQIAAASSRPTPGIFMLFDRLADILPGTASVSVTPIANLALTGFNLTGSRYSDGDGVMAALFCQTVVVGSPVINITYTNQAGVGSRTSKNVAVGAAQALSITPIPLQDGDTGIQSVQSYNIVTAGTSGALALVLYKPIASFVQPTNTDLPGYREMWEGGGLTRVYPEACLEIVAIANTATTASNIIAGRLGIVEG